MSPGLFPRKMRLILTDKGGEGIDLGRLSAKFQISRRSERDLAKAKIEVFNLSESTIGKLSGKFANIQLDAGYPQRIGTIFKGQIRNVFSTKDGPDKITTIFAADGYRDWSTSTYHGNFPARSSVKNVVESVIATFKDSSANSLGSGISGSLEFLAGKTLVGAWSESGMTRRVLDGLEKSYGFRWSIQGGIVQIIDNDATNGISSIEVSRETGMIGSPIADEIGIGITTLLDHRIVPGRRINVVTAGAQVAVKDSRLQDSRNLSIRGLELRDFEVQTVVHIGESRGQVWYTKAYALPPRSI